MNFLEIFNRCQSDNRSLIMPSNFQSEKIPDWYTDLNLEVRGQSEFDRLYLEFKYPLSESMIPYDSNGIFQLSLSGILAKNEYKLNNLYRTIIQTYNPIENYDRYEDTSIDSDGTSSSESTGSTSMKKTGTDTLLKSGSVVSTKSGSESTTKTGSIDNSKNSTGETTRTGSITDIKSGSETTTKTGSITDSETETTSNTKTGSIDVSKNGRENHTRGGSALETVTEAGTETKTTSGETLTSNKQRAFNSTALVETSATSNTMPTSMAETTSFDGRTTSKETSFTNYSDDVFFDNVTDKTEYNDLLESISAEKTGNKTFSDVTDTTQYNAIQNKQDFDNLKDSTTLTESESQEFNSVKDDTLYNDVTNTQTFNNYSDTTTYNTDESGTDSTSTSGSNKMNQKTTSHIHGNVGVTTSAQMLESERRLSEFDFIDILYKTIVFELSCGYVEEEWCYD